jgi:glycosyltransferase involved in cell wall biosynthesis
VIWGSKEQTLELPEPLWTRFVPRWILFAALWRLRRLRGIRTPEVVFFAIENQTPDVALLGSVRLARVFGRPLIAALGFVVKRLATRAAFGTEAAAANYTGLLAGGGVKTRLCRDLPLRRFAVKPPAEPLTAAFAGRLEDRKGILELLIAWRHVESVLPRATLRIFGDGPRRHEVELWSRERPLTRIFHGMVPREQVIEEVARCVVLVAPSVRSGRWREQVCLAIQEGLCTGATIVTTSETGLASWLQARGHWVVEPEALSADLGVAIVAALQAPLPSADVLDALPAHHGRLVADMWMHQGPAMTPAEAVSD